MRKYLLSLLAICLVAAIAFVSSTFETEAKTKTIEMKIKNEKMQKVMEKDKAIKKAFEKRIKTDDLKGSIKLDVKFQKADDEKVRKVTGKAQVSIGNQKIKFNLNSASLTKLYDPKAEENVYHLTANSTFNKEDEEQDVALYLTWNEKGDKQQGALSIGDVSDYAVIVFGEGEEILTKDKDIRDFKEIEFNENEYEEE